MSEHINGGHEDKGGHNAFMSKVAIRPDPPTPTNPPKRIEAADRIEALEAKLDRISDAWSSAVYCDLENGVASLNTRAEDDFAKRYPSISAFGGELRDIILEGESE